MKKLSITLLKMLSGLWVIPWIGALLCLFVIVMVMIAWMMSGVFMAEIFIRAMSCGVPLLALAGIGFYYSEVEPYS